jgi:hypothetical protein
VAIKNQDLPCLVTDGQEGSRVEFELAAHDWREGFHSTCFISVISDVWWVRLWLVYMMYASIAGVCFDECLWIDMIKVPIIQYV